MVFVWAGQSDVAFWCLEGTGLSRPNCVDIIYCYNTVNLKIKVDIYDVKRAHRGKNH